MDYKFLDKVLDQIVSETEIDYEKGIIHFPFINRRLFASLFLSSSYSGLHLSRFFKHCEDVYGLNEEEMEYVWDEYTQIISDKLKNNG